MGLRAGATWAEVGGLLADEAGLAVAPGLTLDLAPRLTARAGRWWAAVAPRLVGRPVPGGRVPHDALLYRGWPAATTLPLAGEARAGDPAWTIDVPRAEVGVDLGAWALSAGWAPRAVGPQPGGGLTASATAPSYPALTARRTRPFRWPGVLGPVAPSRLLVRLGATSAQVIRFRDPSGPGERRATPLLAQWLVGWDHAPWWTTSVTQSALAASRGDRSVWRDLPSVVLPGPGTTWAELERGAVTDRILTVMTELRLPAAWPAVPARGGRLWAEYGGEDAIAEGVPELSAPAFVAGLELAGERLDAAFAYGETRHPTVLWYAHSGFTAGYAHDGWVLGRGDGGAAETWQARVGWRPCACRDDEVTLEWRRAAWGGNVQVPGDARRASLAAGWRRGDVTASLAVVREETAGARDTFAVARVVVAWSGGES